MDYDVDYSDHEEESLDLELKKEMFKSDCTYDFIDLFCSIKEVVPYFSRLTSAKLAYNIIDIIIYNKKIDKSYDLNTTSKESKDLLIFIYENISNIINTNKKYYGIKNEYTISFDDIYKLLN